MATAKYTFEYHFNKNFSHNDEEINNIFALFQHKYDELYPEGKNYPRFSTILECLRYISGRTDTIFVTKDVSMVLEVCSLVPELKEKYGKVFMMDLE